MDAILCLFSDTANKEDKGGEDSLRLFIYAT